MSKYTDEMFIKHSASREATRGDTWVSLIGFQDAMHEAMEAQREACIEDLEIEWDIYSGMINCIRNARVEGDD